MDKESRRLPADVYVPGWLGGGPAWVDVAITSPTSATRVVRAATTPGHASSERAEQKRRAYQEAANQAGATFIPFVLEEFGGMGKEAVAFIKVIARGYAHSRGLTLSQAVTRITQSLVMMSQRGLACAIEARRGDARVVCTLPRTRGSSLRLRLPNEGTPSVDL